MIIIHKKTNRESEVNDKTASTLVKGGRYRYAHEPVELTPIEALTYIELKLEELKQRELIIEQKEKELHGESTKEIGIDEPRSTEKRTGRVGRRKSSDSNSSTSSGIAEA